MESNLKLEEDKHNKSLILQLHSIRSSILKNEKKIKDLINDNVVPNLIKFLTLRDERIVNISLSILSFCWTDNSEVKKVLNEIMPPLSTLMQDAKNNTDSIHYNCCKLLGNIAKFDDCSVLHEHRATELIVKVLNHSSSKKTRLAALRVLRLLWVNSTIRDQRLMIKSEFLFSLSGVLSLGDSAVLNDIVYLILNIIRLGDKYAVEQIFDSGICRLLADNMNSRCVRHVTLILSRLREMMSRWPSGGFVSAILDVLKESENTSEVTMLLLTLYNLTNEARCRLILRDYPGSIQTLLRFVDAKNNLVNTKYILLIFRSFQFEVNMLKELANAGLFPYLIKCIEHVNAECGVAHDRPTDATWRSQVQKSLPGEVLTSDTNGQLTDPLGCYELQCQTDSLKIVTFGRGLNNDIMIYSANQEERRAMSLLNVDSLAFDLIRHFIYHNLRVYELVHLSTWKVLFDYLILVRRCQYRTSVILYSIIKRNWFILPLIKSEIPLLVNKLFLRTAHARDCTECEQLEAIGKNILLRFGEYARSSTFVEKIFNDDLSSSQLTKKVSASLIVSCIYFRHPIMNQFANRYPILSIVLETLRDEERFEDAMGALCSICGVFVSKSVDNTPLPSHDNYNNRRLVEPCRIRDETEAAGFARPIFLRLDDDTVVRTDRVILSNASPVFRAMFNDGFKEAALSEVRLYGITAEVLKLLYHSVSVGRCCPCLIDAPLAVLLEAVVQSDKFLITDENNQPLLYALFNCKLDCDNCADIYRWTQQTALNLSLAEQSCRDVLTYLLSSANVNFEQRCHGMRSLLQTEYADDILDNVRSIALYTIDWQMKHNRDYQPYDLEFICQ